MVLAVIYTCAFSVVVMRLLGADESRIVEDEMLKVLAEKLIEQQEATPEEVREAWKELREGREKYDLVCLVAFVVSGTMFFKKAAGPLLIWLIEHS
jgi:hypothetical protein